MFDDDVRDHFESHLASPHEAMLEEGREVGAQFPQRAWILTNYDVWVRNPAYQGPPKPHPESYQD